MLDMFSAFATFVVNNCWRLARIFWNKTGEIVIKKAMLCSVSMFEEIGWALWAYLRYFVVWTTFKLLYFWLTCMIIWVHGDCTKFVQKFSYWFFGTPDRIGNWYKNNTCVDLIGARHEAKSPLAYASVKKMMKWDFGRIKFTMRRLYDQYWGETFLTWCAVPEIYAYNQSTIYPIGSWLSLLLK